MSAASTSFKLGLFALLTLAAVRSKRQSDDNALDLLTPGQCNDALQVR